MRLMLLFVGTLLMGKDKGTSLAQDDDLAIFQSGDLLGSFKLKQRIDVLGLKKMQTHNFRQSISQFREQNPSLPEITGMYTSCSSSAVDTSLEDDCIRISSYCLGKKFFVGGHGEVWRASLFVSRKAAASDQSFILKRMVVKNKPHIYRCALREIYFGDSLKNEYHVARYETFFIHDGDYWLVFKDEGVSLHQLLYSMKITDTSATLEPSQVWYKLRSARTGSVLLKGLLHEIITSVSALHDRGILHRDIKPSNIVLNVESDGGVKVLMIDFSSAVDADSLTGGLYGATGPTLAEASEQYLPPESIFGSGNPAYSATQPMSYDVWSIGVIWLEILLGTADVFTVDQRTLAMLNYRMRDSNPKLLDTAVLLAAMADYCIYRPDGRSAQGFSESSTYGEYTDVFGDDNKIENILNMFSRRVSPVRCSVDQMAQAIQSRDPLGMGFHDSWGLDLLYRMLSFSPSSRISLRDALEHAYFKGPHESTFDGSLHGTPRDAQVHDCSLDASRSLIKCVEGSVLHSEMRISFSNVASQITDLDLVFGTILEQSRIVNGRDLAVATPLSDSCGMIEPGQSRSIAEESNRRSSALLRIDGLDISRSRIRNEFLDFIAPLSTDIRGLISIDHTQYSTELEQPICPVLTAGNDVVASSMALSQGASTGDFAVGFSAANYHEDVSPVQDDPVLNNIDFKCPKCGRIFHGSYQSCLLHVKHRKHGTRCVYHTNTVTFPECISEHAMLPIDPSSGWCDLQGRRMKMEDTHAVAFSDIIPYKYFGVFDGHFGHHASHFAAEHLQPYFEDALLHGLRRKSPINETNEKLVSPCGLNIEVATSLLWQESFLVRDLDTVVISANEFESGMVSSDLTVADVKNALFLAFKSLHSFFLDYSKSIGDNSGTTATVALLFPQHIAISHVGDSRAVLCCGENRAAIALTLDHTPAAESERLRVEQAGGYVSKDKGGHIYRVNGKLAVTRSVGDREFEDGTISHLPDILFLNRPNRHAALNRRRREIISSQHHIYSSCYNKISASESVHSFPTYDFLILASDGLWDVISNDEAVQFVCDYLHLQMQIHINSTSSVQDDFLSESILYVTSQYLPVDAIHNAARELSLEAYVRGSSDNIGVCIVEID